MSTLTCVPVSVLNSYAFFIMFDFRFENVVYRLSLFLMYFMGILTRPRVFLPGAGLGFGLPASSSLSLTSDPTPSADGCSSRDYKQ